MAGPFAVMGLLALAYVVARPHVLDVLIRADMNLWSVMIRVPADWFDHEGAYQRTYRRVLFAALGGWIVVNLALFALSYVSI